MKLKLICVLIAFAVAGFIWNNELNAKAKDWTPKIHKTPHVAAQADQEGYSGPPPWEVARPDETFSFPIKLGETGPVHSLFSGPPRYPFYCRAEASGLGQPLVDNQEGYGIPVYREAFDKNHPDKKRRLLGYSKDCSIPTQVHYLYKRINSDRFYPLSDAKDDIEQIAFNGELIDFIVRVETGTINRFLYAIYSLKGPNDTPSNLDVSRWNKKLIYFFHGGVGIGKQQGKFKIRKTLALAADQIADGYAMVYSTGNQTSVHYNIQLAEDTALRVKKQFTSQFGEPIYTVGVGGSGGAIQQYLLAQNNPGNILDAAIPLYSYPDMITQTTYSFDCELLEYYFDVTDKNNKRWKKWKNRAHVEGMNASSKNTKKFIKYDRLAKLAKLEWPSWGRGASSCTNGWRGLTPLVNNPLLLKHRDFYSRQVIQNTHWTYWDDLKNVFGTDSDGFARSTWDNVGVQYGLEALKNRKITFHEFIKLNQKVGGWKAPNAMREERLWFYSGHSNPRKLDLYSSRNMLLNVQKNQKVVSRTRASTKAIEAAYQSGNVFLGGIDIPILEVRHYLENDLDMHHLSSSFSARQRILQTMGNADHHVLWVTHKPHVPVKEAFDLMDQWLMNLKMQNGKSIIAAKPDSAIDRCYKRNGDLIAEGDGVWDGDWNNKINGACSSVYPSYSNSRIVAGAPWDGELFKCELQSILSAISKGLYGDLDATPYIDALNETFPEGVCDYTKAEVGTEFLTQYRKNFRLQDKEIKYAAKSN